MRIRLALQALSAMFATALLIGCSGGSATAPMPLTLQGGAHSLAQAAPAGYYSCPATGTTEYVSDYWHKVINIYHGNFHSQAPCGQITSGLLLPLGLYVDPATHDLYVANTGFDDVLVFHKGQTASYNTYTDPTYQTFPVDVTLAPDGTVLASNLGAENGDGSLSSWIGGPNGGTFVGHFLMTNDTFGGFITVKQDGTVYYNDQDQTSSHGALWSLTCPAGACGVQTRIAHVSFEAAGGMVVDSTGDLLAEDGGARRADIFELPNPTPKLFKTLAGGEGMGIDQRQHHWFTGNGDTTASEYFYPSGVLIGTVRGARGGSLRGIAVDPGN